MNFHFISILKENFLQLSRIFLYVLFPELVQKKQEKEVIAYKLKIHCIKKIRRAHSFNDHMPTIILIT